MAVEPARRVEVCGIPVDTLTMDEVVDDIDRGIAGGAKARAVFSVNVDMLVKASRDAEFGRVLRRGDILIADGMPILWMARGLRRPLPERVTGCDLVPRLAGRAAARGYGLFLLGAVPGVAERAGQRLTRKHPGLRIAGISAPPLGFERNARARAAVRAEIARSCADIVLVALGAPKAERWILEEGPACGAAAYVAIGGTLDILAGDRRRAPRLLQRCGLEWFLRLVQEPRRLGRRYLLEDSAVVPLYARALYRTWREGCAGANRRCQASSS
jgi:N-acetylglucosaminyldiphosphoundecaprenol N-acetyl-beta-D-mannosaminyltransferase